MPATPICTPRGSETGFEEVGLIGKEKSASAPVSDDRVEQKIGYQAACDEFSVFAMLSVASSLCLHINHLALTYSVPAGGPQ